VPPCSPSHTPNTDPYYLIHLTEERLGTLSGYIHTDLHVTAYTQIYETSKISDLLNSGDPDIKLICINCIFMNKGFHREQSEWSYVT